MSISLQNLRDEMGGAEVSSQTQESREWFFDKVRELAGETVDRRTLMNEPPLRVSSRQMIGKMYMFYYKPKGEAQLPYYDRFPLIFLLERKRDGFLGLNLHYLPYDLRQQFFYNLVDLKSSNRKFTAATFIKMDYNYIKGSRALREWRPCIKRYLEPNIQGKIVNVPAQEWERAIHMPIALWKKKPESAVWRDSRAIIRSNQ